MAKGFLAGVPNWLKNVINDVDTRLTSLSNNRNLKTYTTFGQLGLTSSATLVELIAAMSNGSIFVSSADEIISANTPLSNGVIEVYRANQYRATIHVYHTYGNASSGALYVGHYNPNDPDKGVRWFEYRESTYFAKADDVSALETAIAESGTTSLLFSQEVTVSSNNSYAYEPQGYSGSGSFTSVYKDVMVIVKNDSRTVDSARIPSLMVAEGIIVRLLNAINVDIGVNTIGILALNTSTEAVSASAGTYTVEIYGIK